MISVIIPCYNAEPWLATCINSALNQEFVKEIIVVDDFSTDKSWEIINEFQLKHPAVIKGVKNTNKGGNNARRYGFEISSGEFIQWLDADDILLPGKLAAQLKYLQNNPQTDIVYSDWQIDTYDTTGKLVSREIINSGPFDDFLYELLKDNWRPPHNYLVRRKIAYQLHEILAWNPDTLIAQDREYFTKAALYGAVFGYLPGNYIIYNLKKNKSVSNALRGQQRAIVELGLIHKFEEELNRLSWVTEQKKVVYQKALYSQLAYQATFYKLAVKGKKLSFFTIRWRNIPGFKQKLRIFKNLLK